jgi:hypothetical protein
MADVVKEKELWVHSYRMPPDIVNSIKMEVGIEDCLHIEFEYNKAKYVVSSSRLVRRHRRKSAETDRETVAPRENAGTT